MILSAEQTDALTELINIAFARTAAALSDMTGHRVTIAVPQVEVCPSELLSSRLEGFIAGDLATIHQVFSGPIAGNAMLMLNEPGAALLVDLLTDMASPTERLDTSAREVLTEVGNILLNACLGVFGNLLKVHVTFSVPNLRMQQLDSLVNTLVVADEGVHYALLAYTSFELKESTIQGCLAVVLGVSSLERLLEGVNRWIEEAGAA